jgi:ABC-type uncharacterized transport system permease subunit
MPNLSLFLLDALIYLGLAALFWPGGKACCRPAAWHRALVLVPLLLHLYLLQASLLPPGSGINLGFASSLSAMAALTVLFYAMAAWFHPIGGLQGFVLAFAGLAVALHAALPGGKPMAHGAETMYLLHLLMAFTAYGLFGIATLHAVLISLAERHLHRPVPPSLVADLPPLLTLERLLFRMIEAGFTLLTLTLLTGVLFSESIFGKPFVFNHMTVFGVISWLVYCALLLGRRMQGWRGRKAIHWAVAGFVALMLSYFGVIFVHEIILGRA